ncbi:L-aspartate oxidase [Haloquadratum walsbyi]|jgi:L-aspartate oxidase (EC 1.4.3.16)|uniref:L-aspartate oxidase n=1 Tax=Haloquadratum walsbyi J07HQW2 TaxID=1238425 RepID=U1MY15_9EURY|nr:FAD-dependent oxidoreductase [Haloquadratum walsbyi]ERG95354.1 MAG: aspartate oxidase [Haloquadratum walsbyi J07HQW2]
MSFSKQTDILVIGSGIAGCAAALAAARNDASVMIVTKATEPSDASTDWAQGGIAVTGNNPESFREDIIEASDGEAHPEAVDALVDNARGVVDDMLIETLEIPFDGAAPKASLDAYDRGREAAHSERRILHVNTTTGEHILRPFLAHLQSHDDVEFVDNAMALELLTHEGRVHGTSVLRDDSVTSIFAGATILATGGVGACYETSTNPEGATGDGIAMAALAGARIADMQYVQFHPTAYPGDEPFLVSEAVRGEGAVLRNATGDRFMPDIHPDAELAPRDIVARSVAAERNRTGEVRLDVAPVDPNFDRAFPGLTDRCNDRDIDLDAGIPVAPAEHYLCGGIAVNTDGKTTLDRLYAAGECARTGVHGANRLASTSLLEGLVWGRAAGRKASQVGIDDITSIETTSPLDRDPALPASFVDDKYRRLRNTMETAVGIERTNTGLSEARSTLRRLKGEVDAYTRTRVSQPLYELRNATICGLLITRAANDAPSAGCHQIVDTETTESTVGETIADD